MPTISATAQFDIEFIPATDDDNQPIIQLKIYRSDAEFEEDCLLTVSLCYTTKEERDQALPLVANAEYAAVIIKSVSDLLATQKKAAAGEGNQA